MLKKIEEIAEALVLADLSDTQSLAALRVMFEGVGNLARQMGVGRVPAVAFASAALLDRIIMGESKESAADFGLLNKVVSGLQEIVRDSRPPDSIEFPVELGIDSGHTEPASGVVLAPTPTVSLPSFGGGPTASPPLAPHKSCPMPAGAIIQDPTLVAEFVVEAKEYLDGCDQHLLKVESNPGDPEAVNAVFRAFHTIKGVGGFIGLDRLSAFAHEVEMLLDKVRCGALALKGGRLDLLFESVDVMRTMIETVRSGVEAGDVLDVQPDACKVLVDKLKTAAAGERPAVIQLGEMAALSMPVFINEAVEHLDDVEKNLLVIERYPADHEAVNAIFRAFHTIKGGAVIVGLKDLEQFAHNVETLLDHARDGKLLLEGRPLDIVFEAQACMKKAIQGLKESLGGGRTFVMPPEVSGVIARVAGILPGRAGPQAAEAPDADARGGVASKTAVEVKEVVRVDSERLDRLLNAVGELVITVSMVCQSEELRIGASARLARHLSQLSKITRLLQEMGTSLRMVPVKAVFQKMARLARDLSRKSGKDVEFVMSGEDTELDKSVVDKIGDPLVHMVRNAVDHGIEESPAERTANGKAGRGRIELRAFHKGGNIHIEIEDDGKGLDRERILAKAAERGLVPPDAVLTDSEICNLIFAPGLSTASQLTELSGRGVGMDVVKRNIEELRGAVDIRTEKGRGSVFSIRLPLTLAVIDGMIVRVGAERYIIPTLSVRRTIQPRGGEIATILGKGEALEEGGRLIPVFRLYELFGIEGAVTDPLAAIVVVVEGEGDGGCAGLMVDELVGQEQIVIKNLGESLRGIDGISGGTIMPDGLVGLILDVGGIIRLGS